MPVEGRMAETAATNADGSVKTLDQLGHFTIPLCTGEIINFRRMSDRERDDFRNKRLCWLAEHAVRIQQFLRSQDYENFILELYDALSPQCVDKEDAELIIKLENAMVYREDALSLAGKYIEVEFAAASAAIPKPDEVESMTDGQVKSLGES